jgi:hypothetical protein
MITVLKGTTVRLRKGKQNNINMEDRYTLEKRKTNIMK